MATDHTFVQRPFLSSPGEYAIAALVALTAGAIVLVWVTGQLAGLVFGFTWIDISLTGSFDIALALPGHLADPQMAWPATSRDALPGPVGFYLAFAVTLAALASTTVWAIRHLASRKQPRGFASRQQLAASLSYKASLVRAGRLRPGLSSKPVIGDVAVELGRAVGSGMRLAAPIDSSVLLLAAPRVGKTSQVIIPWLADWPGPALVTSVRRDVADNTYRMRKDRGPVAVLDLSDTQWPDRLSWSPTTGCENFDKARQRADVMVRVGKNDTAADSTNAGFFGTTATNLMAGWLHAAAIAGLGMDSVLSWALDETNREPLTILGTNSSAAPGISQLIEAIYRAPSEPRSSMWATAVTAVAPLLSAGARRTFCPTSRGFDIEEFLRGSGTVYVHVSESQAGDLAPLISAFVDEITIVAKSLGDATPSGRLDPPLGMILDEVANVAPLPSLPALMSYGAGSGIFIVAVLQHLAGAKDRWGTQGADMLWGAATVKIALGGLAGEELDKFSALAGDYRERVTTISHNHAGTSTSTNLSDRRTLKPGAVRTLSTDQREALVLHAATPPVKTRMRRHYETHHSARYADSVAHMQHLTGGAGAVKNPIQHTERSRP